MSSHRCVLLPCASITVVLGFNTEYWLVVNMY